MKFTLYQQLIRSNEAQLLRRIFADLEYLGMIGKYGNCCLFINALAAEILKLHEFEVELRPCIAVIDQENRGRFLLGAKEYSQAHQLPSHVVCIVNKTVLLDFGLGNVRRYFDAEFFQAMLLPLSNYHAECHQVLCEAHPAPDLTINYVADEAPAMLDIEIAAQRSMLEKCLSDYRRYTKNRLKFNVVGALRKLYRARPFNSGQAPELTRIVGNFDDTWFD